MQTWQIQKAKNHFNELIDHAIHQGAQQITRNGKKVVVVVSNQEFEQTKNSQNQLIDTLLNAPRGEELDLHRSQDEIRDLEL